MNKIAICENKKIFDHPFLWNKTWEKACDDLSIIYDVVDPYALDNIAALQEYDTVLWHYVYGVHADIMEASNILGVLEHTGVKVFPNYGTRWHLDDKIAESYALFSLGAPIPKYQAFFELDACEDWIRNEADYPIVAKLKTGSGSNNVKLLRDENAAMEYSQKMFGFGMKMYPSITYKTFSKLQSSHNFATIVRRIKCIPNFLNNRRHQKRLPRERDYCYFQELIPNDGFDIKLAVVGNKASYLVRKARKGDFRASGSGDIFYDRTLVTREIVESAFATSDALDAQCMGYDYVVNNRTGKGYIIEMCFGFDWEAIYASGGYWDRNFQWYDEPLNVPKEILSNIVSDRKER